MTSGPLKSGNLTRIVEPGQGLHYDKKESRFGNFNRLDSTIDNQKIIAAGRQEHGILKPEVNGRL